MAMEAGDGHHLLFISATCHAAELHGNAICGWHAERVNYLRFKSSHPV